MRTQQEKMLPTGDDNSLKNSTEVKLLLMKLHKRGSKFSLGCAVAHTERPFLHHHDYSYYVTLPMFSHFEDPIKKMGEGFT